MWMTNISFVIFWSRNRLWYFYLCISTQNTFYAVYLLRTFFLPNLLFSFPSDKFFFFYENNNYGLILIWFSSSLQNRISKSYMCKTERFDWIILKNYPKYHFLNFSELCDLISKFRKPKFLYLCSAISVEKKSIPIPHWRTNIIEKKGENWGNSHNYWDTV